MIRCICDVKCDLCQMQMTAICPRSVRSFLIDTSPLTQLQHTFTTSPSNIQPHNSKSKQQTTVQDAAVLYYNNTLTTKKKLQDQTDLDPDTVWSVFPTEDLSWLRIKPGGEQAVSCLPCHCSHLDLAVQGLQSTTINPRIYRRMSC